MQDLQASSPFQKPLHCDHPQWRAELRPLSNGRLALREFCFFCKTSSDGSSLGPALPMTADADATVQSYKYPKKTFGEILKIDPSYLIWIVCESKATDRFKKSAARLLCGVPYTPPQDGAIYDNSLCYDATTGWACIRKIQAETPTLPFSTNKMV